MKVIKFIVKCFLISLMWFSLGIAFLWASAHPIQAAEPSEPEWVELGTYTLYHYCPCAKCCGKETGITSCGVKATRYRTIAMSDLPYGSVVFIEGYGYRCVEDRGGGIGKGKIDIFTTSHQYALELGVKKRRVWIIKNADPADYF